MTVHCQLYWTVVLSILCLSWAYISSAISHCIVFQLTSVLSFVLLHTFEYTILFSLNFSVLHNLSWYQSFSSKPLHTVGRATRSSQRRAYTHLESTRHSLFTRLGELFVILFKYRRKKLVEEEENTEGETCTIYQRTIKDWRRRAAEQKNV